MTLADVQQYTQPISYGVTSYELNQWLLTGYAQDSFRVSDDLTLDLGLRYDRQTLTDATKNFAPRVGFGWHPNGDSRTRDSRRLRPLLHADPQQRDRGLADRRPRRLHQLHGDARTARIPDVPDRTVPAAAVRSEDAAGVAAAGARHHDSRR